MKTPLKACVIHGLKASRRSRRSNCFFFLGRITPVSNQNLTINNPEIPSALPSESSWRNNAQALDYFYFLSAKEAPYILVHVSWGRKSPVYIISLFDTSICTYVSCGWKCPRWLIRAGSKFRHFVCLGWFLCSCWRMQENRIAGTVMNIRFQLFSGCCFK